MVRRRGVLAGAAASRPVVCAVAALAWLVLSFALPATSDAMPFFSRQIGRDCSFCHSVIPKLNETGREFRAGGYRFEAEGDWKGIRDYAVLPVSFEAEVEAELKRSKASGVETRLSDIFVEEAEVMAGGAVGRSGRISALVQLTVSETTTGTDVSIPKAFVQVNDLVGPVGAGRVNLRGGKWDVGLPFLYPTGRVISRSYLADSVMRVIATGLRGVEANGTAVIEGDAHRYAHRYGTGVVREDLNGDEKIKGLYAYYSLSLDEFASVGALYRQGEDASGPSGTDVAYRRYGLAAEAEAGPFIATLGWFHGSRSVGADRDDLLAEALWLPAPGVSVGARYEVLREDGKRAATQQSVMARYHVMSNAYVQAELTELRDPERATGAIEYESVGKLLLVGLF